jgi:mRNA-degrading endonuclease RelE of RelBE toxin-antitoxin system
MTRRPTPGSPCAMPYRVTITRESKAQLQGFEAREQRIIVDGIAARLQDQPTAPSRAVKPLRPNPFADYELRLGDFRVLYCVDEENSAATIVAVGRKVGNKLIVEGEEFHGHQGDPAE